jgi:hypothetical protein
MLFSASRAPRSRAMRVLWPQDSQDAGIDSPDTENRAGKGEDRREIFRAPPLSDAGSPVLLPVPLRAFAVLVAAREAPDTPQDFAANSRQGAQQPGAPFVLRLLADAAATVADAAAAVSASLSSAADDSSPAVAFDLSLRWLKSSAERENGEASSQVPALSERVCALLDANPGAELFAVPRNSAEKASEGDALDGRDSSTADNALPPPEREEEDDEEEEDESGGAAAEAGALRVCVPEKSWYTIVRLRGPTTAARVTELVCDVFQSSVGAAVSSGDEALSPQAFGLCRPAARRPIAPAAPITKTHLRSIVELRRLPAPSLCVCALPPALARHDDAVIPLRIAAPFYLPSPEFAERLRVREGYVSGADADIAANMAVRFRSTTTAAELCAVLCDLVGEFSRSRRGVDVDLQFFALRWVCPHSNGDVPRTTVWLKSHRAVGAELADSVRAADRTVVDAERGWLEFAEDTEYKQVALAANKMTQALAFGSNNNNNNNNNNNSNNSNSNNSSSLDAFDASFGSAQVTFFPRETVVYHDESVVHSSGMLSVAASAWKSSKQHAILSNLAVRGACLVTNFRVIFTPHNRSSDTAIGDTTEIPLQSISEISPVMLDTEKKQLQEVQEHSHNLLVDCKVQY